MASPTYQLGLTDGEADAKAASECPPAPVIGPNPPFPAYPVMYMRGYLEAYEQRLPCHCDGHCRAILRRF